MYLKDKSKWKAMLHLLKWLENMKTWQLARIKEVRKPIKTKQVFDTKTGGNINLECNIGPSLRKRIHTRIRHWLRWRVFSCEKIQYHPIGCASLGSLPMKKDVLGYQYFISKLNNWWSNIRESARTISEIRIGRNNYVIFQKQYIG